MATNEKASAKTETKGYDFGNYKNNVLTKPRNLAWKNWGKFVKVGDMVQGYIRDVFFRPAEGKFQNQRGITIEQKDGTLINVAIKRLPYVLVDTNELHIGDPLTIELVELKEPKEKGLSPTKIFGYYGQVLPENAGTPTVATLEAEDMKLGGTVVEEESEVEKQFKALDEKPPFPNEQK